MSMVGQVIRKRRCELHLTQEVLAERIGFRQNRISKIESGKTKQPGKDDLRIIASALGISVNKLLMAADYAPDLDSRARRIVEASDFLTDEEWAEMDKMLALKEGVE